MTLESTAKHEVSVAVWDLAGPVVVGRRATLKVGVSCSHGCALARTTVEMANEDGERIACDQLGSEPWPQTRALFWVELDVAAPANEGDHMWRIHASPHDASHETVMSLVRVVASRPPEHRIAFEVIEKGSGAPLGGVELRVGAFRGTTIELGTARVDVPRGTYDVHAWKLGYDLLSTTVSVVGDATVQLELMPSAIPERPYWM